MFFALVYLHTARGLHYGSYKAPRELLWIIRVTILVLMMATAFFGYTLPWGKMSFWGARTTSSHPTIPFLPSPSRRPHIVPEWYLLPYYAILRAIPNKLAGVIAMFGSIGVLFLVPWLDTSRVRSGRFRPVYRVFFWFLIAAWLVLAYCGSKPPEGAYVIVARVAAAYYFATS